VYHQQGELFMASSSSSSARPWPLISLMGGVLALIGYFLPWFLSSENAPNAGNVSGLGLVLNMFDVFQQGSGSPILFFVLAILLLVGLAALAQISLAIVALSGRLTRRAVSAQIGIAIAGLALLALAVAFFSVVVSALANLDTGNASGGLLIPGFGAWLIVVGFLDGLVSGILLRRSL
jgi:hypothetical protein